MLHELGYKLTKINPKLSTKYHHNRDNMDQLPDEDIINHPSPCPTKSQSKSVLLNKTTIADRDTQLTQYIKDALTKHTNICAQSEFDIGQIPNSEFKIEFRAGAETTPIRCAEYPHNIKDVAEIERQLRLMIEWTILCQSHHGGFLPL